MKDKATLLKIYLGCMYFDFSYPPRYQLLSVFHVLNFIVIIKNMCNFITFVETKNTAEFAMSENFQRLLQWF